MFYDNKLSDVYCNSRKMFICKMGAVRNGFLSQLNLADHLYNLEKDIVDLKVNMTLLREDLKQTNMSYETNKIKYN